MKILTIVQEKWKEFFKQNKNISTTRKLKVINDIKNKKVFFENLSQDLRDNKEIFLEAVKENILALKYASESLTKDKEVIIEAIKNSGLLIDKLSSEFAEKDFETSEAIDLFTALNNNTILVKYAFDVFKNDRDLVFKVIKHNSYVLEYCPEELKDDKEIVFEAVKKNVFALMYASDRLKDDKEIVSEAVKKSSFTLINASERLQSDKELLEILENSKLQEKSNYSSWNPDYKKWYENKMEILANIRDKELMDSSITVSDIKPKKIKF